MLAVVVGFPAFAWLTPTVYVLAAMQFGATAGPGHAWWAVIFDGHCSPPAMLANLAGFAAVATFYALRRPMPRKSGT